jgi:ActR/RegA family two-component response regulator
MAARTRILFVDDEPAIRMTLPAILHMHGYEVVAAGTVAEALGIMAQQKFDVLISDLNIGNPGDGFTVVSAMRRTQPDARTFILTGYPAFETALEAIRAQVDDYLIKPADIEGLVRAIEQKISHPMSSHGIPVKRLCDVIEESIPGILEEWLRRIEKHYPDMTAIKMTREERIDDLPQVLSNLVDALRAGEVQEATQATAHSALHGAQRRRFGYSLSMLLDELAVVQDVMFDLIQQKMLSIDVSYLIPDLKTVECSLDIHRKSALQNFLPKSLAA